MRYPEHESGKMAYRTYQCGVSQILPPINMYGCGYSLLDNSGQREIKGAGSVKEVGNSAVCAGQA